MIFEIIGEPMGKQRPRFARVGNFTRTYTPKETASYENLVKLYYEGFGGEYFGSEPLKVKITAYFKIPKSFSKKKVEQALNDEIRPSVKPDIDNCCKIIFDALNGFAFDDDKQIVELTAIKKYSDRPRVVVEIEKIF